MTGDRFLEDNEDSQEDRGGFEEELRRLSVCYRYASAADRGVIWAVLNKYVPMLTADGLL